MTAWGWERYRAVGGDRDDGSGDMVDEHDIMMTACAPPGLTRLFQLAPRPMEMLQLPGRVVQLFEWDHWVRQIWTDGRKHPEETDQTWMGHSIGWYEGDTFVVDTVGFNDKTWIDNRGHPHSEQLHLVERYRRVDQDTMVLDLTFEDPKAYTRPWSGQFVFVLKPSWDIQEEVFCEDRGLLEPPEYIQFVE